MLSGGTRGLGVLLLSMNRKFFFDFRNSSMCVSVLPSSEWWRYAFIEHHLDALAALVRFARQTDFLQLMELVSVSFSIAGRENRTSRRLPWLCPHQRGSGGFQGSPKKKEANRLGVCCLLFFFSSVRPWCWYPAVSLSHSAFHTLDVPSFLDMLLCVNSCVFTRAF